MQTQHIQTRRLNVRKEMVDRSSYKVGVVLTVEEVSGKKGNNNKPLKVCRIDIGDDEDGGIPVVTNAPNVREGSRIVVAPAGSEVINDQGEEITLTKTSIAGHESWGMICDSKLMGWSGGAEGIAVQIPDDFPIGSTPPSSKPRPKGQQEEEVSAGPVTDGLYERKLTKEEKKKLAAEKRAAKKAAKAKK